MTYCSSRSTSHKSSSLWLRMNHDKVKPFMRLCCSRVCTCTKKGLFKSEKTEKVQFVIQLHISLVTSATVAPPYQYLQLCRKLNQHCDVNILTFRNLNVPHHFVKVGEQMVRESFCEERAGNNELKFKFKLFVIPTIRNTVEQQRP